MTSKVAIIGSGNIGTDLLTKIQRLSETLEVHAMCGIDADSPGLARAKRLGCAVTHEGIDGLVGLPGFDEVALVFDATSASAHRRHDAVLRQHNKIVVDLTPAALGPYVVPTVNLDANLDRPNVNMVTCGGQATIPIVAAISAVARVRYAEIVASIASRSAGPGTRANIDEFTQTTARGLEAIGGADRGKAIIILNPAEPPVTMRDTVFCVCDRADRAAIAASVQDMVGRVASYVGGYALRHGVQFEEMRGGDAAIPGVVDGAGALKVSAYLQVEGAGHYLPTYAGNLDIMTSAALRTAERFAETGRLRVAS